MSEETPPKTVADAKEFTLRKIKKCMELPREERQYFWYNQLWFYRKEAFCFVNPTSFHATCPIKEACDFFDDHIDIEEPKGFFKKNLRTLHRMVKEVRV